MTHGPSTSWLVPGLTAQPNGKPSDVAAADALVAAHARPDVFDPALAGLEQQVAVGDVCSSHADDVGLAGREHPFGDVGVGDPAGVHHRERDRGLEPPRQLGELAGLDVGRLDVAGVAPRRADHAVDVVDQPGRLEVLRELDAPVDVVAARQLLADVHPHADGHRVADDLADGAQALQGEPGAALHRAAVAVLALVGQRGQEPLVQVVVVQVQLDAVCTAVLRQSCGLGVLAHEGVDVVLIHHVRHQVDRRSTHHVARAVRHPALVDHLHGDRGVPRVHCRAEGLDPLDELRQPEEAGGRRADPGRLETRDQRVAYVGAQGSRPTRRQRRRAARSRRCCAGPRRRCRRCCRSRTRAAAA